MSMRSSLLFLFAAGIAGSLLAQGVELTPGVSRPVLRMRDRGVLPLTEGREISMNGHWEVYWQGSSTWMRVDQVRNNRSSGVSGPLRLAFWYTPERPVFGEGFWGYLCGTYNLGTLAAGSTLNNIYSGLVPFSRPRDGIYHPSLVLEENVNGEWFYVDFGVVNHRDQFGSVKCSATDSNLCLNGGRFHLWTSWTDFARNSGTGKTVLLTGDTGYFWFFNSANVELVTKVLDGRGVNGKYWVFYGALSNVEYTLKVTDLDSGVTRTYYNPSGKFASTGDTNAFSDAAAPGPGGDSTLTPTQAETAAREIIAAVAQALRSLGANNISGAKALEYIPIGPVRVNCQGGGRIELSGDMSGQTNNGTGGLFLQLLATLTDCRTAGLIFNGDPYISVTGTFTFINGGPGATQYMRAGGGIKFLAPGGRSGACPVSLSVTLNTNTATGNVSGTFCGQPLNVNY